MDSDSFQEVYHEYMMNVWRVFPIPDTMAAAMLSKKIVACFRKLYTKSPAIKEKSQISINASDEEISKYLYNPVVHSIPQVETDDGTVYVSLTSELSKATDFSNALTLPDEISEDAFMTEIETPSGKKKTVYCVEDDVLIPKKEKITLSNGKTMLVNTGEFLKERRVLFYYDNKARFTDKDISIAIFKVLGIRIGDNNTNQCISPTKATTHRTQEVDNSQDIIAQKCTIDALQHVYEDTLTKLHNVQEMINKQQATIDSLKKEQPQKEVKIQLLQQSMEDKQKVVAEMEKSAQSIQKDLERENNILLTMRQQACSREEAISMLKS